MALAADTNAQTEQQNKKKKTKEVKDVNFNVYLHCEDCIEKVNENIAFEKGVKDLKVSLEDQTVTIKYDAAKTSEEVLKAAIEKLGYPKQIFQKLVNPGTVLGDLTAEVAAEVGYNCKVVAPATHDTGSAVIAVPTDSDNALYISSGTWSLMGVELMKANCSPESKANNLTNEGGYDYRFRYLKNIMGLWMIQSVKKEIGGDLGFGEICDMASKCTIPSIVDANDDRFMAPENMTEEAKKACAESGQPVPEDLAEVASVIYNSLAQCYAKTIGELESITGQKYDCIHIVGGGANADYLNKLTAKATGLPVFAGPTEATAIGNLAAQMMAVGDLANLKDARACVFKSFEIKKYN